MMKIYKTFQENPSPNKCLGVFGLSLRTTERDLRDVFSRYGPIEECTVVIDAQVCALGMEPLTVRS